MRRMMVAGIRLSAFSLVATLVLLASNAFAEDTFKVAIGAPDIWGAEVPRLGQRAGIFKKHGILLGIYGVQGAGETLQAVISRSADFGIAVGTAGVMRAYSKGAPIRVIGANFTGVGDLYWYVRTESPITRLEDATNQNTIAYSSSGSTSHSVVLAFVTELGLKAKPTSTGAQTGTLTQVMSGQIDIGWATSPFGLKEVDESKIRIVANGNDLPSLRQQTVRVEIVNADVLKNRNDAVLRFVSAYRETLEWMYAGPEAIKMYAEQINVPISVARSAGETFQTKQAKQFDRILDVDAVMVDAVKLKFLEAPLTKEQLADLIQIPPP